MGKTKRGYLRDIIVKDIKYKWMVGSNCYDKCELKIWDNQKTIIFMEYVDCGDGDVITPKYVKEEILKTINGN